jgi:hypothetical protein
MTPSPSELTGGKRGISIGLFQSFYMPLNDGIVFINLIEGREKGS